MPRITQVQKVEQDNEQQALAFFEQVLGVLPDPRRRQGVRYPLRAVVVIGLMGMVCGCDDAEAMELWRETSSPKPARSHVAATGLRICNRSSTCSAEAEGVELGVSEPQAITRTGRLAAKFYTAGAPTPTRGP